MNISAVILPLQAIVHFGASFEGVSYWSSVAFTVGDASMRSNQTTSTIDSAACQCETAQSLAFGVYRIIVSSGTHVLPLSLRCVSSFGEHGPSSGWLCPDRVVFIEPCVHIRSHLVDPVRLKPLVAVVSSDQGRPFSPVSFVVTSL